ncbi:MAG: sugar transferase [Patescibacteria group bacterium]|nr:sugar transferase [Patescibacteria group bacterium]MCX7589367.1 sugar transferase [Patescibacteria group bacterium]MDW8279890.1 sugar transferase [bacterium]
MIGFLFLGDVLVFYLSLILTLVFRYQDLWLRRFNEHFLPFSFILILWLLVFYISGLYEKKKLRNVIDFFKTLFLAIILNIFLAITFFYFFLFVGIRPKINLFIFCFIFLILEFFWRRYFNSIIINFLPKLRILLITDKKEHSEIYQFLFKNKQFGYEIAYLFKIDELPNFLNNLNDWQKFVSENKINIILVPFSFKSNSNFSKIFYELLSYGIVIYDMPSFYELIFKKVPLFEINEEWFLDKILNQEKFYDKLKEAFEFVFALFLFIVLLPLEILIAILIKLTSRGPVIYKQVRVGKNNQEFVLYKFRTMREDAEKDGPQWKKSGDNDPRFTLIGKILAKTHLDELPQLINILKGEISFVGPRPERPEFIKILEKQIPYYNIRHLIKPGITGWAQINYKYGASIEDAYQKLQYDIYYIKNKSIILDLAIIIKTIKNFFVNN